MIVVHTVKGLNWIFREFEARLHSEEMYAFLKMVKGIEGVLSAHYPQTPLIAFVFCLHREAANCLPFQKGCVCAFDAQPNVARYASKSEGQIPSLNWMPACAAAPFFCCENQTC